MLDSVYRQEQSTIAEAILKLTRSAKRVAQNGEEIEAVLAKSLSLANFQGDLTGAIIAEAGKSFGCVKTVTFDKKAVKLENMSLL